PCTIHAIYLLAWPPDSLFLCSPDSRHRDLHSFPTRRSSDLGGVDHHVLQEGKVGLDAPHPELPQGPQHLAGRAGKGAVPRAHLRSEEHTSELQSRENLVCRLLLEKKKGITPGTVRQTHREAE